MRIAIMQFPGSNCERETMLAVERAGMEPMPFLWNESVKKLQACDGYIVVGGFSYQDRCRAGMIASLDPVLEMLKQQSNQGKPVLGICNGAQILVESGLVPGFDNNKVGMALTTNKRMQAGQVLGTGFYNDWVYVTADQQCNSAYTQYFNSQRPLHIPAAHAEGRFIIPAALLEKLTQANVGIICYCDEQANIKEDFPVNPNGSVDNIAGIGNLHGNVMALMPHPERTVNGDVIFAAMRDYIQANKPFKMLACDYVCADVVVKPYQPNNNSMEFLIETIITDNAALSVQKALQNLGMDVQVKRYEHWEINSNADLALLKQKLVDSCELFNPNKEFLREDNAIQQVDSVAFLVREKEDFVGQYKKDLLAHHFSIKDIDHLSKGVVWQVMSDKIDEVKKTLIERHILFNPHAHDCYTYCRPD